jgi:hypothetical protein
VVPPPIELFYCGLARRPLACPFAPAGAAENIPGSSLSLAVPLSQSVLALRVGCSLISTRIVPACQFASLSFVFCVLSGGPFCLCRCASECPSFVWHVPSFQLTLNHSFRFPVACRFVTARRSLRCVVINDSILAAVRISLCSLCFVFSVCVLLCCVWVFHCPRHPSLSSASPPVCGRSARVLYAEHKLLEILRCRTRFLCTVPQPHSRFALASPLPLPLPLCPCSRSVSWSIAMFRLLPNAAAVSTRLTLPSVAGSLMLRQCMSTGTASAAAAPIVCGTTPLTAFHCTASVVCVGDCVGFGSAVSLLRLYCDCDCDCTCTAAVGYGRMGVIHAMNAANSPRFQLKYVVARNQSKLAELVRRIGRGVRPLDSLDKALSDSSVRAVLLSSATSLHTDMIKASLQAGKAVFVEKPVGTSIADIEECFRLARAKGLPLLCGYQRQFDPSFQKARQMIANGDVGTVQLIRIISKGNQSDATHSPLCAAAHVWCIVNGTHRNAHPTDCSAHCTNLPAAWCFAQTTLLLRLRTQTIRRPARSLRTSLHTT